jgi:hypothetical protein
MRSQVENAADCTLLVNAIDIEDVLSVREPIITVVTPFDTDDIDTVDMLKTSGDAVCDVDGVVGIFDEFEAISISEYVDAVIVVVESTVTVAISAVGCVVILVESIAVDDIVKAPVVVADLVVICLVVTVDAVAVVVDVDDVDVDDGAGVGVKVVDDFANVVTVVIVVAVVGNRVLLLKEIVPGPTIVTSMLPVSVVSHVDITTI